MAASQLDWLVARPIAHRGLHDRAAGRYENTVSAARAAIAAGYAIECDVQLSADGEAMVFHDFTLDRLTDREGPVAARTAQGLADVTIGGTADRIPSLARFLDVVGGAVPLICEIKSAFDGDLRLAQRVLRLASAYSGPLALKSFDPAVLVYLRGHADLGTIPLGVVAEARYDDPEWDCLSGPMKAGLAALAHFAETRPQFLSYHVDDLPHAAGTLFRAGLGRPVVGWTVRTAAQRERAATWADQMVFEGFLP